MKKLSEVLSHRLKCYEAVKNYVFPYRCVIQGLVELMPNVSDENEFRKLILQEINAVKEEIRRIR